MITRNTRPRVRFCWECGRKLYGNRHIAAILKQDKRERILHKQCYELNESQFEKPDERGD